MQWTKKKLQFELFGFGQKIFYAIFRRKKLKYVKNEIRKMNL